jgi:hypothetical protein
MAILIQGGWDDLFIRSLELNRRRQDFENVARTTHYLAHAHLRDGDAGAAWKVLREGIGPVFPRPGNTWDAFLRAKIAHLENGEWVDAELDRQLAAGQTPYSAWLYVVAVARQFPRSLELAIRGLELAVRLLRFEADGFAGNVCNLFAEFLELNIAARLASPTRWLAAVTAVHAFLSTAPDHLAYYGPVIDNLPSSPDLNASEAVLNRVPYF